MPAKKKITLALVYEEMIQRFGRLDQIDTRLDRMDSRFDQVDSRFDQVDSRFAQVDDRFTQMDKQFAEVAKQFFRLEDSLKAEINSVLDRLRNVEQVLDKLTADVETLRQEYFALLQSVRRIEETLSLQVERDTKRDADLKEIFARLERVESRLERIESQGRSN